MRTASGDHASRERRPTVAFDGSASMSRRERSPASGFAPTTTAGLDPDLARPRHVGTARNNHNLAISGRTILNTSDDRFLVALDADTGELAWETWSGGKDWRAGALSPVTGLIYMQMRHACVRMLATDDAETGAVVWRYETRVSTREIAPPRVSGMPSPASSSPDRRCQSRPCGRRSASPARSPVSCS